LGNWDFRTYNLYLKVLTHAINPPNMIELEIPSNPNPQTSPIPRAF
jgi:hypothetical protein